jgi:hypothetical protein
MVDRPKLLDAPVSTIHWQGVVMDALAAQTIQVQARSNAAIAKSVADEKKYQFASPARNDTARAFGVILGEIAIAVVGKLMELDWHITALGMLVIGGIYGIPKGIREWVTGKTVLPRKPGPTP